MARAAAEAVYLIVYHRTVVVLKPLPPDTHEPDLPSAPTSQQLPQKASTRAGPWHSLLEASPYFASWHHFALIHSTALSWDAVSVGLVPLREKGVHSGPRSWPGKETALLLAPVHLFAKKGWRGPGSNPTSPQSLLGG